MNGEQRVEHFLDPARAAKATRRPRPPTRMGPLSPRDLEALARRYLRLADAGLATGRPHQAEGAVFALAGILDLLGEATAADRARRAAGTPVTAGLVAELKAAVEKLAVA